MASGSFNLTRTGSTSSYITFKCTWSSTPNQSTNSSSVTVMGYTLYEAKYTFINAQRAATKANLCCAVAGRCCESGDLLGQNVLLAEPSRGEILAVLTTGAYNFSMASGYNRLARPALVWVEQGQSRIAVRRQSLEDLLAQDL